MSSRDPYKEFSKLIERRLTKLTDETEKIVERDMYSVDFINYESQRIYNDSKNEWNRCKRKSYYDDNTKSDEFCRILWTCDNALRRNIYRCETEIEENNGSRYNNIKEKCESIRKDIHRVIEQYAL